MSAGNRGGGDARRPMACAWLRAGAFSREGRGVRQMPGKDLGEVERN